MTSAAASAAAASDAFRALADPTRRAILDYLSEREHAAGELVDRFHVSQPAISQHLGVLREAGLVAAERVGRRQMYRVRPEGLAPVRAWMARYEKFWSERLDRLGALLDGDLDDPSHTEREGERSWPPPPPPPPRRAAASSTRRSASSASTRTRARRSGGR